VITSPMTRRYHLELPFWIYTGLTVLVALAASSSQNNLLFWIFGVMASLLLLSGVVSGVMMSGLRVRRLDPQHGAVGEPLIVRYAVTNRNRLVPVFNIHIEERTVGADSGWDLLMASARAWMMHIAPRERAHGEVIFWPTQRGEARFDQVRIWTTFPFGIIKKSVTFSQPQHTLIYPLRYRLRRRILDALAPVGPIGARVSRQSGLGDDYYGMREYRPGDSMRHIAWKRSACLDQLICIERSRPSPPKLRVVLDLTTPTDKLQPDTDAGLSPRQLEERAISLAASVIHAADLASFEVGLAVPGTDLPVIPIRRNAWHVGKLMAALAGINLNARSGHDGWPIPDAEPAGLVVIHPDRVLAALGRPDAWHLTARQIDSLTVHPIGHTPGIQSAGASSDGTPSRSDAAA